jgi:hypothetical protein
MQSWSVTDVVCTAPLRLLDLRADGCLQNKIPTDAVRAQNHLLGQLWAYAIHEHPDQPDGIMFSSRLNEATNVAVFDRAMPKMNAVSHQPLFDYRSELAHILTKYQVGLVGYRGGFKIYDPLFCKVWGVRPSRISSSRRGRPEPRVSAHAGYDPRPGRRTAASSSLTPTRHYPTCSKIRKNPKT